MLDYLDDIESDMSAIHRVDDMYEMPALRFFSFADRLTAYKGVLRARAEVENEKKSSRGPGRPRPGVEVKHVPVTDPSLSKLIQFG